MVSISRRFDFVVAIAYLAVFVSGTYAAELPNRVVEFKGDVSISNGSTGKVTVAPNSVIPTGAIVETGEKSSIKILMSDKSLIDLGAKTKMTINKSGLTDTQLDLDSGKVRATVVKRAATRPQFVLKNRGVTMGVRGTQFVVSGFSGPDGTYHSEYFCLSGSIQIEGPGGKKLGIIEKGFYLSTQLNTAGSSYAVVGEPKPQVMSSQAIKEVRSDQFLNLPTSTPFSPSGEKGQQGNSGDPKKPTGPATRPPVPTTPEGLAPPKLKDGTGGLVPHGDQGTTGGTGTGTFGQNPIQPLPIPTPPPTNTTGTLPQ